VFYLTSLYVACPPFTEPMRIPGIFPDGTFVGEKDGNLGQTSGLNLRSYLLGGLVGSMLLAVCIVSAGKGSVTVLSDIDRDDGTTALVNAILVARADKFSTQEASNILGIDPKLPFLGVSAYSKKHHHDSKSRPVSLMAGKQQTQKLWMPNQFVLNQNVQASPALFQSLEIDPSTQFCSDPDDCLRNDDYFKEVIH
jgi:hypothetical protein